MNSRTNEHIRGILEANGVEPDQIVGKPHQTAFNVLEGFVMAAFDKIEGNDDEDDDEE